MSRGETLKGVAACRFRRLSTPGCRSVTGDGLDKPNSKAATDDNPTSHVSAAYAGRGRNP
jgi:hypothetical protein